MTSVAEVAFGVLRQLFRAMRELEPGTRLGEDVEILHDMRVAIRRQRAALKLFGAFLPPRLTRLRRELTGAGRALGDVRDLDVQLAQLERWRRALESENGPALDALADLLRGQRARARGRMLRVLDSRRWARLSERLERLLLSGPTRTPAAGAEPILAHAPALIGERFERMSRLGRKIERDSPASRYHRLRIHCKSLRYALEFHAAVYGRPAKRAIRALVELQDLLGEHQDAEVSAARLRAMATEKRLPPLTLFVMGKVAQQNSARAHALRESFPIAFRRTRGKRWRALHDALREGRAVLGRPPETAADTPAPPMELA